MTPFADVAYYGDTSHIVIEAADGLDLSVNVQNDTRLGGSGAERGRPEARRRAQEVLERGVRRLDELELARDELPYDDLAWLRRVRDLTDALGRYQDRAKVVAKALGFPGFTLGQITITSDRPPMVPVAYRRTAMAAMADAAPPVPTEGGNNTVTVSVSGNVILGPGK